MADETRSRRRHAEVEYARGEMEEWELVSLEQPRKRQKLMEDAWDVFVNGVENVVRQTITWGWECDDPHGIARELTSPLWGDSSSSRNMLTVYIGRCATDRSGGAHERVADFLAANHAGVEAVYGWYERAALLGRFPAQLWIGRYYLGRWHAEQHDPELGRMAIQWLRCAHVYGSRFAALRLKICYEDGEGVERDHEKAVFWHGEAYKCDK